MVKGGGYTWENSVTYRLVHSLCGTPEVHVILNVNYTAIFFKKAKQKKQIKRTKSAWGSMKKQRRIKEKHVWDWRPTEKQTTERALDCQNNRRMQANFFCVHRWIQEDMASRKYRIIRNQKGKKTDSGEKATDRDK